jgi:hypothetical protein
VLQFLIFQRFKKKNGYYIKVIRSSFKYQIRRIILYNLTPPIFTYHTHTHTLTNTCQTTRISLARNTDLPIIILLSPWRRPRCVCKMRLRGSQQTIALIVVLLNSIILYRLYNRGMCVIRRRT